MFKRFGAFSFFTILLWVLGALILAGGCHSGDSGPSAETETSAGEMPGSGPASDATGLGEPAIEMPQPSPGLGPITEGPTLGGLRPVDGAADAPSLAPLGPAEDGLSIPAPLPEEPAQQAGLPPISTESTRAVPMPAPGPLTPLRPVHQAPKGAMPPASFSENPLREGTDDFRPSPPLTNPPGQAATDMAVPAAPLAPAVPAAPAVVVAEPARKKLSKGGKHSDEKFDPIAENGSIFVGWKKPRIALVISGRQDGYLEPCGCAGLDRMKGGLTRRHSMFKELRADGWPVVSLDCGGLIKGFGRQAELKFHLSVDAMQQMGYDAIALGRSDLRLPAGELLSKVASTEEAPSPFLSANVAIIDFALGMTADHRIVEAGGVRVGITSVLGTKWQKEVNNSEIVMADPQAKLREVLPKMKGRCDLLVLLAHATMEESKALATAFPDFDIVVTGGGDPEPPEEEETLANGTLLIEVGEKGMNAIVLGVYDGGRIEYQRVPLDSRFEDSPDMKAFMRQYQEQLKADGLSGLGIRQVPHSQAKELGKFVGSKECVDCHEPSYDVWKKTGHADGWKTLKELEVPRTHDPECISCHVIGWHPTEYFPYESGFLSEAETPKLIDVGCENCHGPGEKHIAAEMGADEDLQKKLQKLMVVTKEQARDSKAHWCLNCHDLDNSPDFNFEEYWPKVEHYEDVFDDEDE